MPLYLKAHFKLTTEELNNLMAAEKALETVRTAIRTRVQEELEYKAMHRLYSNNDTTKLEITYQGVTVSMRANAELEAQNVPKPASVAKAYLEPSLVNTLLHGKLLTDFEKRQLVEQATGGTVKAEREINRSEKDKKLILEALSRSLDLEFTFRDADREAQKSRIEDISALVASLSSE